MDTSFFEPVEVVCDPPQKPIPSQFERQEGGDHYRKLPYDLAKFAMEAGFDAMRFSAFKYICRLGLKGDHEKEIEDTKKAIHFLQMRLEHKHGVRSAIQYQHP